MTKEQKALLELLIKAKQFMDDNGITFYLFGGSCIGALRHNGFIPWDDDVDIIMDRENYNKLMELAPEIPDDDMEFVCFENNSDYFRPFGQFASKTDTYFLKSRVYNKGKCMGTIIDVFVLDYVPSEHTEDHKKALIMYEEVLGIYRIMRNEITEYKDEYYALVEAEKTRGRKAVVEELKKEVEKYSPEESDTLVARFWIWRFRQYKKSWFGKPKMCDFEGVQMPVPSCPEATLRLQYGYDWYILPEEEMQYGKGFYINHNISSNNYVEDMEQFIDSDGIESFLERRKHLQVERLEAELKLKPFREEMSRKRWIMEVGQALSSGDTEALEPLLRHIGLFRQGNGRDILPQELLASWIHDLVDEGRYYDAAKAAEAFTPADVTSEVLKGSLDMLERVKQLAVSYQDNDTEGLRTILDSFTEEEKRDIPDCILAECRLMKTEDANQERLTNGIELCDAYLRKHPTNYDVLKQKGDLLFLAGDGEMARKLYSEVLRSTRNGLDILDIQKSGGKTDYC